MGEETIICANCGTIVVVDSDESMEDLTIARLKYPKVEEFVPLCDDCYDIVMTYNANHPISLTN